MLLDAPRMRTGRDVDPPVGNMSTTAESVVPAAERAVRRLIAFLDSR